MIKLAILRAAVAFLGKFAIFECKTIGYLMGPQREARFHCMSCSIYHLLKEAKAVLKFWEEGDRWKKAIS